MKPTTRTRVLSIRVSETELDSLRAISAATGLAQSDVVRQLIRAEHATLTSKTHQAAHRALSQLRNDNR